MSTIHDGKRVVYRLEWVDDGSIDLLYQENGHWYSYTLLPAKRTLALGKLLIAQKN